jgi:hypothetical protein
MGLEIVTKVMAALAQILRTWEFEAGAYPPPTDHLNAMLWSLLYRQLNGSCFV